MAEISYKDVETHIQETPSSGYAPIYLIYGEELLVTEAYRTLLEAMLPQAARSLNFEAFDGMDVEMSDILERLNTFSLMDGPKVLALLGAQIFSTRQDLSSLLIRSKQAADAEDFRKAARYLLAVLAAQRLSMDDLASEQREDLLKLDAAGIQDGAWLDRVVAFCRERNFSISESRDQAGLLQHAIETGFPKSNHLLITTDRVDKRTTLYAAITTAGMIVDCSVPKGDRRADRQVQVAVLRQRLGDALEKHGKSMDPGVFEALVEKSGFDLRTFTANVEKLVDYTGDRPTVSFEDVESVLTRTKKDPIYEFTNAVTNRDVEDALFYMHSLLGSGELSHPLQLLAGIANQIRKLILMREFMDGPSGSVWHAGLPFQRFRQEVMPLIQEHDRSLTSQLDEWADALDSHHDNHAPKNASKRSKRRKRTARTDLLMAPNPKNAYPVYLMMRKAAHFSREELLDGYAGILEADFAIKSGANQPLRVLERVVMGFGRPARGTGNDG